MQQANIESVAPFVPGAELIQKYFAQISAQQMEQIEKLGPLYSHWNAMINVISRKDIGNLYPHHVLHSLGILQMLHFADGTELIDLGTGGGFPAIPLAIMQPKAHFYMVDSIGKKLKVAQAVADELGLKNVTIIHDRAENLKVKADFVISRAVMRIDELAKLARPLIAKTQRNAMPNGLICLKGGELEHELKAYRHKALEHELWPQFEEEFFKTKKVVYIAL